MAKVRFDMSSKEVVERGSELVVIALQGVCLVSKA